MLHDPSADQKTAQLVKEISAADSVGRIKLLPKIDRILNSIRKFGGRASARLRELHDQILDEAMESRFDNVPF